MTGDFKYRGEYPHLVVQDEMRQAIMEEEPMNLPGGLIWVPPTPPQITLRQYLAGCAMQGLVSGISSQILAKYTDATCAEHAVRIADALIDELNKTDKK